MTYMRKEGTNESRKGGGEGEAADKQICEFSKFGGGIISEHLHTL